MHGGGILMPKESALSPNPFSIKQNDQTNGYMFTSPQKKATDPKKFKRKKSSFNGEGDKL